MMMHKINNEEDYGIPCRKARNVIDMFNIMISIYTKDLFKNSFA